MHYINHYNSPLGKIIFASNGKELTGLWFDGQKYFASTLTKEYEQKNLPVFEQTAKWLDIYFSGKNPNFTPPLFLSSTSFRNEVWKILLTIPYGKIMTYGEIAKLMAENSGVEKMSAQSVGGEVGHNHISNIVTCHRVVGTDGSLTGYAGGVDIKEKLLKFENVDMSKLFMPKSK
ncbi:methylated-DNA--[protein]-cysteine S-methyltransferase [Ruminococcus sp.]|uniref:methylated-DNA--[protein]-cysteine S-methyltransferase n=1 Tax=Ruminococcus sp. TaxID=41978 RepID=UPI003A90B8B5